MKTQPRLGRLRGRSGAVGWAPERLNARPRPTPERSASRLERLEQLQPAGGTARGKSERPIVAPSSVVAAIPALFHCAHHQSRAPAYARCMLKVSRRWWAATLATASCGALVFMAPVRAETHGDYREFTLGSPLARVVAQTESALADVVRLHERPSLLQQLRWRLPLFAPKTTEPRKDTVEQIVFNFFDDQLFKITVDYDRLRVEGMTDSDMVDALSQRYGSPIASLVVAKPSEQLSPVLSVSSDVVAGWERDDVAVVLLRKAFSGGFQLVVTSKRLDTLAGVASAEAVRLETAAAPALEVARRQREVDNARDAKERARASNKASFQP